MSIKLYVGNVPISARNAELKELFEKFGKVVECDILKEFAFVHMESDNDAKAAISGLNDSLWKGGRLRVELSTTKTQKGEPARRDNYHNQNNNMNRGSMGHRGNFSDRGRGGGGRSGFNNVDRRGYNNERGGMRGMPHSGGMRGGFRGGRGGDARTMSRGGYQERFASINRRENSSGGGPIRESRFAGSGGPGYSRPYPEAGFERERPPMRGDEVNFGAGGGMGHMQAQNGGYIAGHGQQRGQQGDFNGSREFRHQHHQNGGFGNSDGFNRAPIQNGSPAGVYNSFNTSNQHSASMNRKGSSLASHHNHPQQYGNVNNGPPIGQR